MFCVSDAGDLTKYFSSILGKLFTMSVSTVLDVKIKKIQKKEKTLRNNLSFLDVLFTLGEFLIAMSGIP